MEKEINKMGVEPISKLLIKMGFPMILSMMLQAFYNIVDSYFVSSMEGVGDAAVNALTLAFPIQTLMVAIGVGTGVGLNSLLSRYLGMGDRESASRISGNAIFLSICTYLVFLIFGLVGVKSYISTQTSDSQIMLMACDYLRICTVFSFGSVIYMIYEKLLQATGRTTLATISQISGAVTNIILDPIMIFGLFGFPEMGIKGAAWATVIGQIVSLILGIICHHGMNKELDTSLRYLMPKPAIIKSIYQVGIPAIIMQALTSVMTYGVNIIFVKVSGSVVTAYGMYFKIQQFIFFAAYGLNNAIIPIVAFNYGMRDKNRMNEAIKLGLIYTMIIMIAGALVLQLFAGKIVGIFDISDDVKTLCITAIRIITFGYIFVGANVAFQGIFQALGNGVKSLVLSLVRLIIVPLPLTFIFTYSSNAPKIIWLAFPVAEFIAFIVAIIYMRKIKREKIANI